MTSRRPNLLFVFRKPYSSGNYSVEFLFNEIYKRLSKNIECSTLKVSFFSQGIINRLLICIEVVLNRGSMNIITGDISFANLFLPKNSSILVILDCGFLYEKKGFRRWIEEFFWFRLPIRRAHKVVAISESTKLDLIKITKEADSKLEVIPCFISPIFQKVEKEFNQNKPVLLQVGQARNKNLTRIINALKGLSVHLSIIGEIDDLNRGLLEKYKIEYSSSYNISEKEIFQKYVNSDMLIFPSIYEGFGLPILEAQTVGRAVITSNTTSMPWVAGKGACLVNPYSEESIRDGIERIIDDHQYRSEIIQNGFENIKRFKLDDISDQYAELVSNHNDKK